MKVVAFERTKQGTGASRRLRNAGKVPGIIYGGDAEPHLIELDHNALWHALKKEAFHASVLEMQIGERTGQVLVRDVQYHPYKQQVLHIDFQRVSAKTKIHMKVPLHYSGEADAPAVKLDKCLLNYIVTELEVSCLPADLPESITVDVSQMEKGASISLSQIKLPKGVEANLHGQEDLLLVSVVVPKDESESDEAEAGDAAAPADDAEKK